ncbi:ribulose-phosphate 3-epimerase [Candidatus Sumerlaeota bacterium]|nr:ribulose-phosphate 3-epimerase [Candidatus Sumerlaeota bacterium]
MKTSTSSPKNPKTSANGPVQFITSVSRAFDSKHPDRVLTLAPSVLSANFANIESDLKKMMRAKCYWTHLDVMDGHFVPNITFGPPMVKSIRSVSPRLFLDTHLMISDPLKYAEPFVQAGSDMITIHTETVDNLSRAVASIRKLGVRVGLTVKPRTPIREVEPALDKIDMVLIMSVEPGFGGQGFMPNMLTKVRQLVAWRRERGLNFLIQIDGGMNVKTIGLAVAAGVNVLVAGSAVFGPPGIAQNIQSLMTAAVKMGG